MASSGNPSLGTSAGETLGRGEGGGGGGLGGALVGVPALAQPIHIAVIVTVAIQAATAVISNATVPTPAPPTSSGIISSLKWLHLRMVCEVVTNAEVPKIWSNVAVSPNKQEGLATLV